ncbi:SpoIIE family protein phosphatase [Streptomyces vinaceus]|uniref:SpoIIE family protein phosphatase n=1 Tax=Streptomyces vinaceus TaxID=1960 RepID=UPI003680938D
MTALPLWEAGHVTWLRVDVALPAAARREAAALAHRVGMSPVRVSEVELAITEAATNPQRHAVDGALVLRLVTADDRAAVEFLSLDTGPGLPDVAAALADRSSTGGTLGVGLGAIHRLADTFDIHSRPGHGTAILARFWNNGREAVAPLEPHVAGLTQPISGEQVCGDTWSARSQSSPDGNRTTTVMMCDGLGHGPMAELASRRARDAFHAARGDRPQDIVRELHNALKGTRGAAIAVAAVNTAQGRAELCGVGNISAFATADGKRHAMVSMPGIVGHQLPSLRTFTTPLGPEGILVMYSDGLSDRWSVHDYPGLFSRHPALVAGQLLAERETGTLHIANAGHLPPLIRRPDGSTHWAEEHGPLLGLGLPQPPATTIPSEPGSVMLLITDGLIERPGTDLDRSLDQLASTVRACPRSLEDLCDTILDRFSPPRTAVTTSH